MVKKKKRRIPKSFLYVDKDYGTRSIQHPKTGKMLGRKSVRGVGDRTAVRRVKKGHPMSGQIMGRTAPIKIRASKKARAHVRRRL
jgi:hypothetical protein